MKNIILKKKNIYNVRGITLVEILLYMAILSLIVFGVSSMIYLTFQSRIKGQVMAEVEQQGNQAMEIMLQTLRNSATINTPVIGSSGVSLSVDTYNASTTPTIFELSSNEITTKEGVGPSVILTSDRVIASNLVFGNLSQPQSPGNIKIQFTLSHTNPENMGSFNYSKTFYGTASLRWP